MGYGVWGSCHYGGVCLFIWWQFQESNLFCWGMRMLLFGKVVCDKDTWKCGSKLEKIDGFQIWNRMKWKVTMGRNLCFVKWTHMGLGKSGMIHRQQDPKGGKWSIWSIFMWKVCYVYNGLQVIWHFDIPTNATLKCKLLIDGGVNRFFYCWKMYFDQQNKDFI